MHHCSHLRTPTPLWAVSSRNRVQIRQRNLPRQSTATPTRVSSSSETGTQGRWRCSTTTKRSQGGLVALTAGHQHCWVDEAGWGLPQALSSRLPCYNTRTPAAAQSPSLQIHYATATHTHFVNTQMPPKRTTPKPPHPLHSTSVTTQVKKL